MYCTKCGAQTSADAKYCGKCGVALQHPSERNSPVLPVSPRPGALPPLSQSLSPLPPPPDLPFYDPEADALRTYIFEKVEPIRYLTSTNRSGRGSGPAQVYIFEKDRPEGQFITCIQEMRLDDCRTILRANPPLLRSFKLFLKALDLAMLRRDAETARFILGQWAPQHNVDFLPSRLGGLGSIKSYGELRIAKMPPDQQLSSYNKLLRLLWEIEQWMENSGLIPTQEVPSIDLKSLAHRLMPNTELVAAHLGTWHTTGQKVGAAIDRLVIPIRMPNQFTAGIVGVSKTHLYCMKLGVGSTFRVPDEFAYDRKLLESHLDPRNIAAIELAAVTYAENEFGGYNLLGGGLRVVVLAVYSNHNPLCRIAIRTGDSPSGIVRAIVAGKTHRACPGS